MTEQQMLEQIEALRKEFEGKIAQMEEKFDELSSKVETIDKFVAAITEAQGFEQTMNEVESVTKQLTGCNEAVFYCYDNAAGKFFSGDEDQRNWTDPQSAQDIRSAFDSGVISEKGSRAVIPLISSKGETVGVIAAEKENGFTAADLDYFRQGGQIVGTVELALNKEFEHQGRVTDELTGLKNRQGLNEYVADTVRRNINADKPVNIVMCDIDRFKSINDTYGHDAGDIVLKNVAQILQDGTRSGADCAFRMGGEEMVLILNCEPERAYEIAERLRAEVENAVHTVNLDGKEQEINVTISMGIHQMKPDREMTAENARAVFDSEFKSADELVYAAKESGRNKVVSDISETVIELGSYISDDPALNVKADEKESYSIFIVDNGIEKKYYHDDNTDVNALVQRLADGNLTYPEISKNCTEISDLGFAEFEQSENNPPAFCAEINLSTKDIIGDEKPMELTVWDNEKIGAINLNEAIRSIKDNGTVNLEYTPFSQNDYDDISEDCSKFISEIENIKEWIDEAQDKLEERSNNIDGQSKNEIR